MHDAFIWWLVLFLVGVAALPVTASLLRFLPDRGYAFARPIGLVLAGYLFWILGLLGTSVNSQGGAWLALVCVASVSAFVAFRRRRSLLLFFQRRWSTILATEVLWLVVFALWGLVQSHTPAIAHTEQPMDFALLNGILLSPSFPPNDPWFAGETISYYYGGYLLTAFLVRLTGIAPSIAYNLALMSTAAMAATGVCSLVLNVLRSLPAASALAQRPGVLRRPEMVRRPGIVSGGLIGLLAVALLLFMGNFVGLLEFVRTNGWGSESFFEWLKIDDLTASQAGSTWYPTDNWWWWRSTRVINTFVDGHGIDYTITEFPFFSFMLGDLHPHVMALPFVLLALATSFNALRARRALSLAWLASNPAQAAIVALLLGSLGFINSWDLPTFAVVLLAAMLLSVARTRAFGGATTYRSAMLAWLIVGIGALLFYLPFYLDLQTQATGVLPVRRVMTRPIHFVIAMGPLLWLSLALLAGLTWNAFGRGQAKAAAVIATAPVLLLAALPAPLIGQGADEPASVGTPAKKARARGAWWALALPLAPFALWAIVELGMALFGSRRLLDATQSGTTAESLLAIGSRLWHVLPLMVLIALALALAFRLASTRHALVPLAFPVILVAVALLLAMGAELFHIADFFGNRMNTMFKLYYQVWVLLSISGAVGFWYWVRHVSAVSGKMRVLTLAGSLALAVIVTAGVVFVPAAAWDKAQGFKLPATLDGLEFVKRGEPGEYAAVEWLLDNALPGEVIVEAVASANGQPIGDYDASMARISQRTGLPTILGWPGHEHQWRGNPYDPIRARFNDVEAIYRTGTSDEMRAIFDRYRVTYVIVGGLESQTYGPDVAGRFEGLAEPVYSAEGLTILKLRDV